MKRDALAHPKTLDLAARLNCSRAEAIGLLTLLWNWTADYAIAGDVGRWPNAVIAKACDFAGDPETFISALIDARWLDQDEQHRLVIHDWAQHCENWVRAKAQKAGIELLGGLKPGLKSGLKSPLKSGTQEQDLSGGLNTGSSCAPVPSQAKPSLSQPSQTKPKGGVDSLKLEESDLRSIDRLSEWIDSGSPGVSRPIERKDLAAVVACANEAVRDGTSPLRLFRFKVQEFVTTGRVSVPDGAYDAAKRAVRDWRESSPDVVQFAEVTTKVAGCLANTC